MHAIRTIQTVKNGEVHLQLPRQLWGQEVEIIVLPAPEPTPPSPTDKKSLRGRLRAYANPECIAQEQKAWQTAMRDKHESHGTPEPQASRPPRGQDGRAPNRESDDMGKLCHQPHNQAGLCHAQTQHPFDYIGPDFGDAGFQPQFGFPDLPL
ncbi:MAG: hypothetical protein RLZZ226_228 [Pseudomonadota bacterium]